MTYSFNKTVQQVCKKFMITNRTAVQQIRNIPQNPAARCTTNPHANYSRVCMLYCFLAFCVKVKGKGFPYSIPSVGPGADPGVQAVSLQVTVSHPPGGRLPLFSARPAVTSPAAEHHRPLAGTKLYCLVTEAHTCKQLA